LSKCSHSQNEPQRPAVCAVRVSEQLQFKQNISLLVAPRQIHYFAPHCV